MAPCSDLRLAIGQMSSDRFIMRITPGGYPSDITIPAGDLVNLADANAILTPGTASEMLRIETGADVLLRGVSLRGEGTDVSDDIDGQPRPAGAASDIGADEVGPG